MSKKLSKEEQEEAVKKILESSFTPEDIEPIEEPEDQSEDLYQKLLNYKIVIEEIVVWASREAYSKLVRSFLAEEMDGVTFRFEFLALRTQNMSENNEICEKIEEKIKPIPDLFYTSKSDDFSSAMNNLFFEIERYDPDIEDSDWNEIVYSESKLRSVIRENYLIYLPIED